MFQNNAAKKSDTFHICNETLQESDFAKNPDSSSSSTFVYSYFHLPGSTLHSPFFFDFHMLFEEFESTVLCVVSVSGTTKNSGARMPIWQIFPSAREQNQSAWGIAQNYMKIVKFSRSGSNETPLSLVQSQESWE